MSTQTLIRRHSGLVMESRPNDHVYDPVYTSASQRAAAVYHDRRRTGIQAWNNAFPHTNQSTLQNTIASGSNGQSQALAVSPSVALIDATLPYGSTLPNVNNASGTFDGLTFQITGKDRIKFIKRPLVPFLQAVLPSEANPYNQANNANNDTNTNGLSDNDTGKSSIEGSEGVSVGETRTIGQQTDYREADTQTDPFTPDYITDADHADPEILGLSHLTYGHGLPASLEEVEYIHRLRSKRAFEASLPPLSDLASFERRKALLEERELAEWKLREEEMKAEQEERLKLLIEAIKDREALVDQKADQRIDKVRQDKTKERDQLFQAIHRERIKAHRSLQKQRQAADAATGRMLGADFAPPPPKHNVASFLYPSPSITSVTLPPTSPDANPLATATTLLNANNDGSTNNITASTTMSLFGAASFSATASLSSPLRRDIVGDYVDHGSRVYAPVSREGRLPVKNSIVDYGIPLLSSYQGLEALDRAIQRKYKAQLKHEAINDKRVAALRRNRINNNTTASFNANGNGTGTLTLTSNASDSASTANSNKLSSTSTYVPLPDTRSSSVRRVASIVARDLAYVDSLLARKEGLASNNAKGSSASSTIGSSGLIENVYKKFEPVIRAPTPSVVEPLTHEAERAVLLLQRLLRGRSVQNEMYQGTHHHRHLIKELRIDEQVNNTEDEASKVRQLTAYDDPGTKEETIETASAACSLLVGDILSSTLDFISKELIRVEEEENITQMVHKAAYIRRIREMEESGRRQNEYFLRQKRENVLAALLAQHQKTSKIVVNSWINEAVKDFADETASQIVNVKHEAIEPIISEIEENNNDTAVIVNDLVSNFLLPEVGRRLVVDSESLAERKLFNAAHYAVQQALLPIQNDQT